MRLRLAAIVALLAALAAVGALAGCGEEEETHVVEGEPLELGELAYNVSLTRFLNPDTVEDAEYLVGQEDPPAGQLYLGVFLTIENESDDEAIRSAHEYIVLDPEERKFEPLPSESAYALDVGATVPPDGKLPLDDSTAASGPTQGALLIYLVDQRVTEERPLELEIDSPDGAGTVELDI
jgi:hypothetical protein